MSSLSIIVLVLLSTFYGLFIFRNKKKKLGMKKKTILQIEKK